MTIISSQNMPHRKYSAISGRLMRRAGGLRVRGEIEMCHCHVAIVVSAARSRSCLGVTGTKEGLFQAYVD